MRRVGLMLAVLLILVLTLLFRWFGSLADSKELEQILTTRLSEASGLTVALGGSLEFTWFPAPGLEVQGLSLTNPDVNPDIALVEVKGLRIRLSVIESVLAWQLMLEDLTLNEVSVRLLRDRDGRGNWETSGGTTAKSPAPSGAAASEDSLVSRVRQVVVKELNVRYSDGASGDPFLFESGEVSVVRPTAEQAGQVRIGGRFNQQTVSLEGRFTPSPASPGAGAGPGWKINIKASYAKEALKVDVQGFTGQIPDLSGVSLEVALSSDAPGTLVAPLKVPEWETWAKAVEAFSLKGHVQGDGPDGLSLKKGHLRLGMGEALDLSISGSMDDLVRGGAIEADVVLKSQSPSGLLQRLALDMPPIKTISGEADLRGTLSAPRFEDIKVKVDLVSGVGFVAHGSVQGQGAGQEGEIDLTLRARSLEQIMQSLRNTPGGVGETLSAALSGAQEPAFVAHVLQLGPVDVSAVAHLEGGSWGLAKILGQVGPEAGEWLRFSGDAKSVWPAQSGVQIRLDSRIENPPLAFSGQEALLDHLDSVRVGATWNMQEAARASLEDLEIHVDVTGDISVSVSGSVELVDNALHGAKGMIKVKAQSLAQFDGLAGRPLPPWSPVALDAQFAGTAEGWKLDDLVIGLGRARLKGQGEWSQGKKVPHFALRLNADDLSLIEASKAFRKEAPAVAEPAPDSGVDWAWLSTTQADLDLTASRVFLGKGWVGRDLSFKMNWGGGVLHGPSLDVNWPKGGLELRGYVDARSEQPALELGLAAHGLDMQAIAGWMGQPRAITGEAELGLDLKTQGDSRTSLIAGLDGTAFLHVSHGTVLDRYADALQLGFDTSTGSDEEQPMTCLISVLESSKGVVRTKVLLWDTPIKLVRGLGVLNLNTDHLDLLLRPHLKRTIVRSLTAAIRVEGPLGDLKVRPEPLQTMSDLARGLVGRTLRVVDTLSPQLAGAVMGIGSTTGHMVSSAGLDIPAGLDFLSSPESCESVLASSEVKQFEAFRPKNTISH